jgi:hypothetical protein
MSSEVDPVHSIVEATQQVRETKADRLATIAHLVVVMTILIAASILRALHELDTPTVGTVFGAAMGYATGLTAQRGK